MATPIAMIKPRWRVGNIVVAFVTADYDDLAWLEAKGRAVGRDRRCEGCLGALLRRRETH